MQTGMVNKHNPKRILVIKTRAIGDTLLLTGPLRLLKAARPDHEIDVVVRSPAGELLEGLPYVSRVIQVSEPKSAIQRALYWMDLAGRFRANHYELGLNFHASFRSALITKSAGAKLCATNHHELRGRNWFSDVAVPGRGQVKSIIDRDLDLLRAIGINASVKDAMPEVVLSESEKREVATLFGDPTAPHDSAARHPLRIFLGIGASRETKRWRAEHFVALARMLASRHNAQFVLATIGSDRSWLETFENLWRTAPELEGRLRHFKEQPLRQTAKIISGCSFYVGNDSGLKHLAAALGLPTFTAFGPESPVEWHPYDSTQHPIAYIDPLPCRTKDGKHWCSIPVCTEYGHRCMHDIGPDKIQEAITKLIERTQC